MRAFRFGVSAGGAPTPGEWRDIARTAESLGFDVLSIGDHFVPMFSPFEALLDAAHVTSRIHLAPLVLNNDLRHPALVARQAAMLQLLSGGRFELGLGAGHSFPEYEEVGIPFDAAAIRVARLGESARIIRQLLDGETVDFTGAHYRLRSHRIHPVPATHVPLMIAGGGRQVLRHAARTADIVGISGLGRTLADGQRHEPTGFFPAAVDASISTIREAAAGRFDALELQVLVQAVVVTEDRAAKAEELAGRFNLPVLVLLDTPFVLLGTHAEMAAQVEAHRTRWGISYFSTFWPFAEALAPAMALLRR